MRLRSESTDRYSSLSWEQTLSHDCYPEPDRPYGLEAESTAYVVCQAPWLDTSYYCFGYVATWAAGGDQAIAGIKGSCDRIQKAASAILRPFEAGEQEEAA